MIFYEQPTDPWIPFDFKLLEAFQILEDETCPQCGHPIWLCRSSSNALEFSVQDTVCYAERSLKQYEDSQKKPDEREKDSTVRARWGQHYYTVPTLLPVEGAEMPTRNQFYAESSATTVE